MKKLLKSANDDSFIFHSYSSLLYLSFCLAVCRLFGRRPNFVYDVHDIIEVSSRHGFYTNLKYRFWLQIERYIILRCGVKTITVSQGLKRILSERYEGGMVSLVLNCSIDLSGARQYLKRDAGIINREKVSDFVFFGTPGRFPYQVCKQLNKLGLSIDVYGRGMNQEWLDSMYGGLKNIYFKGEYDPNCLDFLKSYKMLILHSPVDDDNNFKYSMPNKVFQAASYGVRVLVSRNFFEIHQTLGQISGFCQLLPSSEGDDMSRSLIGEVSNDFSNYSAVYRFLSEASKLSKNTYLGMVGELDS